MTLNPKSPLTADDNIYANSNSPSLGRKLLAYVLDILTVFIFSLLLYALVDLIFVNTPLLKNKSELITETRNQMVELVGQSHLDEKGSDGVFLGPKKLTDRYILSVNYHTLKENGVENISERIYESVNKTEEVYDPIYQYFEFKESNKTNFDYSENSEFETLTFEAYFSSEFEEYYTADYLRFDLETAKKIDTYLLDSNYNPGSVIYGAISETYQQMIRDQVKLFSEIYKPYSDLNKVFETRSKDIYTIKHGEALIAYILAQAMVYLLAPSLLKNGKTVTYKIMKLGVVTTREKSVKFWNNLVRFLVVSVENIYLISLMLLCFYGGQSIGLLEMSLIPSVSILVIGLSALFLSMFSYLLSLILKKTRQTFSEFTSFTVLKEGTQYVVHRALNHGTK